MDTLRSVMITFGTTAAAVVIVIVVVAVVVVVGGVVSLPSLTPRRP